MSRKTAAQQRESEKATAKNNWRAYKRAYDAGHENYVRDSIKFNKYYLGDQWAAKDVSKLEAEGRPHLTINLIMKVVNAFLGEQKKQRVDMEFRPRRDATTDTATLMSRLIEQILDHNTYEYVEREVFSDGIIQDRGYFDVRLSFDDNIFGDVSITAEDPYTILPDPDATSYDPADWNEVTKTSWMTLDEIEANYGKEKRDMVEASVRIGEAELNQENIRFETTRTFGAEEVYIPAADDIELGNATIRCVRVVERQWRKLTRRRYFIDLRTGDMSLIPDSLSEERVQQMIKDVEDIDYVEKKAKRIRWTVSSIDVVLHDDWSPYASFTIVPYFPYFRKGKSSGIVRQLVSPQEQHNKYESQMLHVVNTSANSGWLIEAGSLINMDKDELEARGSESGLVLEFGAGKTPPAKIQPNQIPSGLERIADRTRLSISEISGIDPMVGDTAQRKVNNNVVEQQETRNLVQIQVPFDTLGLTRRLLGRKILECVQEHYTEPRVLRVTNWEDLNLPPEEIPLNIIGAAGELINNITLGEYDLTVSTKPSRDTFQAAQFAEAMEMRANGIMIPDDFVIRKSTLEGKQLVANKVAQLTGTADPTEEELQMQQMQFELQIQAAQAEIQKIQSQAMELQARGQEQYAKAQYLSGQEQRDAIEMGAKYQKDMADMNTRLQMQLNDLQNKIQLAQIHSSNKRDTAMLDASMKSFSEEIKTRTALDIARITASSRGDSSGN